MSDPFEQIPFSGIEFADNPEPRCPCLLLLDTSASMQGKAIQELNAGLVLFKDEIFADSLAAKRAEIAIISFGPPRVVTDFQTADYFQPPHLQADNDTPMGAAIELGLHLLEQRKQAYKNAGIGYFRPWIFLITDGGPTDQWRDAAEKIKQGEDAQAFSFFAVGVEGANMDILEKLSVRKPLKLKELRFRDLFIWLSSSMKNVSRSKIGDQVLLLNPATPDGWASV
jgi:uncharacterized protein YegL